VLDIRAMQALLLISAIYSKKYSDRRKKTFICGNDELVVRVDERPLCA
jgi:hypothetical protein